MQAMKLYHDDPELVQKFIGQAVKNLVLCTLNIHLQDRIRSVGGNRTKLLAAP